MAGEVATALTPAMTQVKGILVWMTFGVVALGLTKLAFERWINEKVKKRKQRERLANKGEELEMEQESRVQTARLIKNLRSVPAPQTRFMPPGEAPEGYEWRMVKKQDMNIKR